MSDPLVVSRPIEAKPRVRSPRPAARVAPSPVGDSSDSFGVLRQAINQASDGDYQRQLRSLAPHYPKVWTDIGLGYAALAVGIAGACVLGRLGLMSAILATAFGAVWTGYWMAYLQLFIHEAAHGAEQGRQALENLGDAHHGNFRVIGDGFDAGGAHVRAAHSENGDVETLL